ncbi:hypothetical protein [Novosphingobium gossypii]|uniref:hypothetical protein n=1 Tax=Novosphingobium gossypii TaxID=1604774 RepID=UPI003D1D0D90
MQIEQTRKQRFTLSTDHFGAARKLYRAFDLYDPTAVYQDVRTARRSAGPVEDGGTNNCEVLPWRTRSGVRSARKNPRRSERDRDN